MQNGIWALTEAQAQDLMHLRRLYITRRCVLSMQRKSLMKQIADTDSQLLSPSPTVIRVEKLTEALHENSAEDYEVFYKIARAMYRGVSVASLGLSML